MWGPPYLLAKSDPALTSLADSLIRSNSDPRCVFPLKGDSWTNGLQRKPSFPSFGAPCGISLTLGLAV
jgi:hypothetical protein